MPVEDRVRNLEGNVSRLTERVDGHIKQSAEDKKEAKSENKARHSELMTGLGTLEKGINRNATKLSNLEAVKEAFKEHGVTTDQFQRPVMPGKAKMAGIGAVGVGGTYLFFEMMKELFEFVKSLKGS